jgi:hypothetical protein
VSASKVINGCISSRHLPSLTPLQEPKHTPRPHQRTHGADDRRSPHPRGERKALTIEWYVGIRRARACVGGAARPATGQIYAVWLHTTIVSTRVKPGREDRME